MQKNNIYTINAEYIKNMGYTNMKSVYIPSVHRDYDTYTFCAIFYEVFGIICRIDRVQNTTSDDNFQSVFIYYYETKTPQLTMNRLYPINYVEKRTLYGYSFVKPTEFWVILPNKTVFPDTTMTLDEISAGFDEIKKILDHKEMKDQDELDAFMENRLYLAELYAAENTLGFPYLDTNHNIHQVAQNLKLMRERLCKKDADADADVDADANAIEDIREDKYAMPHSNTKWEGYDEPEDLREGSKIGGGYAKSECDDDNGYFTEGDDDDGYFTDEDATWGEHCRRLRNENPDLDEQHIDAIATYETYGTPNIIFKYTSYGKVQNC
jgi:hypothetical protein